MKKITKLLLYIILFCTSQFLLAKVTHLEITSRTPYFKEQSFGTVGTYEEIRGKAYFAVNPAAKENEMVIDLDKARPNDDGLVTFSADFFLLIPSDRSKINGTLIYEFNNRGGARLYNSGRQHQALLEKGFVIASSGWIGELLPSDKKLRLYAPIAYENKESLIGKVRAEIIGQKNKTKIAINGGGHGGYEPTAKGYKTATLTKRLKEHHPRTIVAPASFFIESSWDDYLCERDGLPKISLILPDTFQQSYIYELIYEAKNPIVQGLGFTGIRDFISFLRYSQQPDNPLINANNQSYIQHTISYGISQSGRALRMFVYDGFNADEQGRIVFDGGLPQVAGAGMGFFNHRFASPTRFSTQRESHLYPADIFPFTYAETTDPLTGRTDGLLNKAIAKGVVPKIMHVQSSAEYWHRCAALSHVLPSGDQDAPIPENVRIYSFVGQHGSGTGVPYQKNTGTIPANHINYSSLIRGLLVALDDWIKNDTPPPPSVYPTLKAGTLGPWEAAKSGWQPIPTIDYPRVIQQAYLADFGPAFSTSRIISQHPPIIQELYPALVPQLDADNNERGMLQLPAVALPTGTYTGWNIRTTKQGAAGELLRLAGGYIPFATTKQERLQNGDPRRSIEERYRDFESYKKKYLAIAKQLIEQRYLLPEELEHLSNLVEKNKRFIEGKE